MKVWSFFSEPITKSQINNYTTLLSDKVKLPIIFQLFYFFLNENIQTNIFLFLFKFPEVKGIITYKRLGSVAFCFLNAKIIDSW